MRSGLKIIIVAAVALIIVLVLLMPSTQDLLRDVFLSSDEQEYPSSTSFSMERVISVSSSGGSGLDWSVNIPIPENITSGNVTLQTVNDIHWSSTPNSNSENYGVNWVTWSNETSNYSIDIIYNITTYTYVWSIGPSSSGNISNIPSSISNEYLHNEEWINVTDPEIVALSRSIVGNDTNVYNVLYNIYNWMINNIKYGDPQPVNGPQTAEQTLSLRSGNCADQSILFCSLARAANVSAWLQFGALYSPYNNTWGGHAWVEMYIPLASGGGENCHDRCGQRSVHGLDR